MFYLFIYLLFVYGAISFISTSYIFLFTIVRIGSFGPPNKISHN